MLYQRLFVIFAILSAAAHAQWLNFPTPGTPRTRDGKTDLNARAPHTRDGKPDLSGIWRVESTPIEEWRRILGDRFESVDGLRVPGMGIGEVSKYGFNLFTDYKAGEEPMLRVEAQALVRERKASGYPDLTS